MLSDKQKAELIEEAKKAAMPVAFNGGRFEAFQMGAQMVLDIIIEKLSAPEKPKV